MIVTKGYRLSRWEECALRVREIAEDGGNLIAIGDKVRLGLPLDMKGKLRKCLGLRISVLRTDADYCIRILDEQS